LVLLVYRFPCNMMRRSKVIGIIPARLGSRRIVEKPLIPVDGKPLIQNIYERATKCKLLDRVLVATNSPRVSDLVFGFGGEAHISLKNHLTGSDRVAEAARMLNYDLIVNIQCDLPNLSPALVDELVSAMLREPSVGMGTLATRLTDPAKLKNPHVVKMVLDRKSRALYFSRRPIPYVRSDRVPGAGSARSAVDLKRTDFYEHIGIYGFRRSFLMRFASWEQTPLEKAEKLEQLRALENGARIKVYLTKRKPVSLDVPSDLKKLRTRKGRMVR
jgi:3-deoxy-manno-octulosonate cytidylyltransferase (CMP-KDO synthetase)